MFFALTPPSWYISVSDRTFFHIKVWTRCHHTGLKSIFAWSARTRFWQLNVCFLLNGLLSFSTAALIPWTLSKAKGVRKNLPPAGLCWCEQGRCVSAPFGDITNCLFSQQHVLVIKCQLWFFASFNGWTSFTNWRQTQICNAWLKLFLVFTHFQWTISLKHPTTIPFPCVGFTFRQHSASSGCLTCFFLPQTNT